MEFKWKVNNILSGKYYKKIKNIGVTKLRDKNFKEKKKSSDNTAVFFQVHIGVRGYVLESTNGTGLNDVRIIVAGINHNLTTGHYGEYYRLLLPGTYSISAVTPG